MKGQIKLVGPLPRDGGPAMAAHGYVEEEWFVEGVTDAFDPHQARIAVDVPYATRFIVRRPAQVAQVSGTLFLDPLHMIGEMPTSWDCADWLMRNGHVWVGVSIHNGSFGALYGFVGGIDAVRDRDPERYATLHLANFDRPPPTRSYPGPSGTDSFALKWNMAMAHPQGYPIVADAADILRYHAQLAELGVKRIYGCGVSQTANFWRLFIDGGWHDQRRRADGGPPFDAYVLLVSPAPAYHPHDAVLVNVLSEAEVVGTIVASATAPPDSDAPPVRGVELPGAPHTIGQAQVAEPAEGHQHSSEPYLLVVKAVFDGVDSWVRGGARMPHVPRIARDPNTVDGIVRDQHGNAVGGVRVPWLEAPQAQYLARCACGPTLGEVVPFEDDRLTRLYASDAEHEHRWRRAVERLIEDRLVLPEDRDDLLAHRSPLRPGRVGPAG
jgi:hypothetical protein